MPVRPIRARFRRAPAWAALTVCLCAAPGAAGAQDAEGAEGAAAARLAPDGIAAAPGLASEARPRIRRGIPELGTIGVRGLRIGMTPAQVRAAGYRLGRVMGHGSGAIGYVLLPARAEGLHHVIAYFIHERMFELWVRFEPLPLAESRAITARLYEDLRAPPEASDGLATAARWEAEGAVVRYSVQALGGDLFAPDLLLQDQAGYLEARVYFGGIPYSH